MRMRLMTALVFGAIGLGGCSESASVTDPTKLTPLTEADKELIKKEDARIQEEEQKTPYVEPAKKGSSKGRTTGR
jgi:hypothetical protein